MIYRLQMYDDWDYHWVDCLIFIEGHVVLQGDLDYVDRHFDLRSVMQPTLSFRIIDENDVVIKQLNRGIFLEEMFERDVYIHGL